MEPVDFGGNYSLPTLVILRLYLTLSTRLRFSLVRFPCCASIYIISVDGPLLASQSLPPRACAPSSRVSRISHIKSPFLKCMALLEGTRHIFVAKATAEVRWARMLCSFHQAARGGRGGAG